MNKKYPIEWFVDQSTTVTSTEDLFNLYLQVLELFGFNRVVYTLITDHHSIGQKAGHAVQSNYPQDWLQYYQEKNYLTIDPVVPFGLKNMHAFLWQDVKNFMPLNTQQTRLLCEAEEAGLRNGVCIPLHGLHGEIAGVGLAQENGDKSFPHHTLIKLKVITQHFYETYCFLQKNSITRNMRPILSQKEIEVLTWLARGKTIEECSMIIECSTANVKYHLANIYRKLDASSRILAITKAIRLGYLDSTIIKI